MSNKLEAGMQYLMETHVYYGELLQRMKRKKCNDISTMGISYEKDAITLYYNEYFLNHLTTTHTGGVLEHECWHNLADHLKRELEVEPEFNRKEANKVDDIFTQIKNGILASNLNMCEDIAINQNIVNLPLNFIIPDKDGKPKIDTREKIIDEKALSKYIKKGFKINSKEELEKFKIDNDNLGLPLLGQPCTYKSFKQLIPANIEVLEKQPFEYYYYLFKEHAPSNDKEVLKEILANMKEILSTLDEHDMRKASKGKDIQDKEIRKEMARQIANQAKKAVEDKQQAGNIPSDILALLSTLNNKPKNWKKDLSSFVARNSSIFKEVTRTKRNRRQRKDEPLIEGYRNTVKLSLLLVLDVSGSMCDVILEQIASESKRISDMGINLILIECDTEIKDVRKYKGEKNLKVHGRGGTCFNPVFELINNKSFTNKWGVFDGLVFFTDGECWEKEEDLIKPKIPVLWAMNEGYKAPVSWGKKTEIIINKK